jgi:hypothetical protein
MKNEYIKTIENNPTKKVRIVTKRISEKEYEMVKFDIPTEDTDGEIVEQLLKEITDDADNEGIYLSVDINKIMI